MTTACKTDGDYSGWLLKEGRLNSEFKKRFFVLHGSTVTYFATETDAARGKYKGKVKLSLAGHVNPSNKAAELCTGQRPLSLCFFLLSTDSRRYTICAQSCEQKFAWLRALFTALGQVPDTRPKIEDEFKVALQENGSRPPHWRVLEEAIRLRGLGEAKPAQAALELAVAAKAADDLASTCALFELGKLLSTTGQHAVVKRQTRPDLAYTERAQCIGRAWQYRLTPATPAPLLPPPRARQ